MSLFRKFLLILPVSLIFAVTGWGQTAAFEGIVKGPDGKPMQNAQIKIERLDVKGNYPTKTDKKGHYFYGGLPLGTYKISVLVDGKDRDFRNNVRTKVNDTQDVSFDLAESGGGPPQVDESGRALTAEQKAAIEKANKEQVAAMAKNKALNDAFNAGKTAAAANQWDGAIENFTKAGELDATQHVVWGNLADSYVSRSKATPASREADLGKAAEAYQKAIAIKADDSAYHNNYALVLAQEKKFDDAQAELTKAAQLDPPNAGKYYFNLGAVLVNTGQSAAAEAAFKKAIEVNPDYADAQFQYATALSAKLATDKDGKVTAPEGMQAALEKYLQLQPEGQFAEAAKGMLQMIGA